MSRPDDRPAPDAIFDWEAPIAPVPPDAPPPEGAYGRPRREEAAVRQPAVQATEGRTPSSWRETA